MTSHYTCPPPFRDRSSEGEKERRSSSICPSNHEFFLSFLLDLGLLPETFPSVPGDGSTNASESLRKAECGCYWRADVPQRPTSILFSPTVENREILEMWIKDYFKTSAFNTISHCRLWLENVRQFWAMRHELYQLDCVLIKGNNILIPKPLRAEVLESLHAAHQGVTSMMSNARQRLFWPGPN